MKYFFIFNPGSRSGRSEKLISRICNLLEEKKIDYDSEITKSLEDAYSLSQKANRAGYDVIVAVGGDGTINKVINGFYDEQGSRLSQAKMGIIYTGTSPDFCKSYYLPYDDIQRSIDVLLKGDTTNIQIGQIRLSSGFETALDGLIVDDSASFTTRYFSCCVNLGMGAFVARYANSGMRKIFGDFLGTLTAVIRAFIRYQPSELTVVIDGEKMNVSRLYNLFIGKTFHVASGIKIRNSLKEGDGRFYALAIHDVRWLNVPDCLKTIYGSNKIVNTKNVVMKHAKCIEIPGNSIMPEVEFDGDPQGFLPCRIEMAKDKLELIYEAH